MLAKWARRKPSKENKITGDDIHISGTAVHKIPAVVPQTFTRPVGNKGLGVTV
jgi:hypothetical protein